MVRGRLPAVVFLAALMLAPGGAHASVLDLIKRVCIYEKPPYGREAKRTESGDDVVDLAPGDPEYDQSLPLLPATPAGWTAEPPLIGVFSSNTIGCGFRIGQTHRRDGKELSFGLLFASGVKDLRDELSKPDPEVTPPARLLVFKGRKGYDRTQAPEPSLSLVVGNMLLTIEGSAAEADMRALLEAANLEAIEAFRF